MSNQYNPKRSWSEKENSNSKKNKMPEKEFNISIQTIELIESSDDELNNS
ncbi:6097_t:CDS:1, partial [Entrophospora sp. SA101]